MTLERKERENANTRSKLNIIELDFPFTFTIHNYCVLLWRCIYIFFIFHNNFRFYQLQRKLHQSSLVEMLEDNITINNFMKFRCFIESIRMYVGEHNTIIAFISTWLLCIEVRIVSCWDKRGLFYGLCKAMVSYVLCMAFTYFRFALT